MQLKYILQNQGVSTRISISGMFMQTLLDAVISICHFVMEPFVLKTNQVSPFLFVSFTNLVLFGECLGYDSYTLYPFYLALFCYYRYIGDATSYYGV